jgi:hypothetical protein
MVTDHSLVIDVRTHPGFDTALVAGFAQAPPMLSLRSGYLQLPAATSGGGIPPTADTETASGDDSGGDDPWHGPRHFRRGKTTREAFARAMEDHHLQLLESLRTMSGTVVDFLA